MKIRICPTRHLFTTTPNVSPNDKLNHSELDLREEYANAFRTESYNVFWDRVVKLTKGKPVTQSPVGSTIATRLSSYRIFVEHLLDPAQTTVTRILDLTRIHPKIKLLLSDYFLETANASFLCSHLLKDVDQTRIKYKSLKATLNFLQVAEIVPTNQLPVMLTRLTEFSNSCNPFVPSGSSPDRIQLQEVQAKCSDLLKRLELKRDKTRAKLKHIHKLKNGSAVILVAFTISLTVIIAVHTLAILVAAPVLALASFELASANKLFAWSAQLDAAAKGTYILIREFDTISRLVGRLNDELEHIHSTIKFWIERGENGIQTRKEVVRQLKLNDMSFIEQLDEVEEHLYLCFMTVNRTRNLVLKEILNPTHQILPQVPNL